MFNLYLNYKTVFTKKRMDLITFFYKKLNNTLVIKKKKG